MKHFLTWLAICMFILPIEAQIRTSGDINFQLVIINENSHGADFEGSPYFPDEGFREGSVIISDHEPLNVHLRLNVVKEMMEVKLAPKDDKIYNLEGNNEAVYKIGDLKFYSGNLIANGKNYSGVLVEHFKSANIQLISKPEVKYTEPVKALTGYSSGRPGKMSIEEKFFLIMDSVVSEIQIRHRDIKKKFHDSESQTYLKSNKIKSLEDLKLFLSFYEKNR